MCLSISISVSFVGPSTLWWCIIKQVVVINKKWKRFLNVLFSASQRGEAYSTPWNWCLINLPFLMWDVVTWSYFFPSLSVETRGQNKGFQSHISLKTQEVVNTVHVIRSSGFTCRIYQTMCQKFTPRKQSSNFTHQRYLNLDRWNTFLTNSTVSSHSWHLTENKAKETTMAECIIHIVTQQKHPSAALLTDDTCFTKS